MLTKSDKTLLREQLFMHLDGIALSSTYIEFDKSQYFKYILSNKDFTLQDILKIKNGNEGYINIGLRLLTSQGLLENNNNKYNITSRGVIYIKNISSFIYLSNTFDDLIDMKNILFSQSKENHIIDLISFLIKLKIAKSNDSIDQNIYHNLLGILIAPLLCAIGMSDSYNTLILNRKINSVLNDIESDYLNISLIKFFRYLDWINKKNILTDKGYFFFKRASAYGVTTSYLPMFSKLNILYFSNPTDVLDNRINNKETHVNRNMNVWGSGGAHSLYFNKIDLIITEIFNRPIDNQPDGISDMGCGDGTFILHLYQLILHCTLRGKLLNAHPLTIIGADFNQEALDATNHNLSINGIKNHILVKADISNPKIFAEKLLNTYNINLNNMINVRSFLDHNRIYSQPQYPSQNNSTIGAFAKRGAFIKTNDVVQNLIEHLTEWMPFCKKFGLLILELHTVNSSIVQKNIGKTLACVYDATHGYSDQYIVSLNDFLYAAGKANFKINNSYKYRFPNNNMPTISINYLISS